MPSRRAFTLVELLVVISVIALLISLLLPALSAARDAAQTSVCLSNIRQLQIASLMYTQEHDGKLIEPGLAEGGISPREELSWVKTLREYADGAIENRSPADESPHWPAERGGRGEPIVGTTDRFRASSYGVNDMVTSLFQPEIEIGPDGRPVGDPASQISDRMNKIYAPSLTCQFVLMAEFGPFAGADHVHVQEWQTSARRAPSTLPYHASQQASIGAHGGAAASWDSVSGGASGEPWRRDNAEDAGWRTRSNYAFLDGHAETMRFDAAHESADSNIFDPRLYR